MEKYAPDFTENFSTAKSPQQMLSALAKSYWAAKAGVDSKSIYMVSIMPCTAKKYEIGRDEYMSSTGTQDTDKVLTTRELARMIQSAGIEFNDLPEEAAGTEIKCIRDHYYLQRVTSKWDPKAKKTRKIRLGYLGRVTPEGLVPRKTRRIPADAKPYS